MKTKTKNQGPKLLYFLFFPTFGPKSFWHMILNNFEVENVQLNKMAEKTVIE